LSEIEALHYDNFQKIEWLKINAKFYGQSVPLADIYFEMIDERRSPTRSTTRTSARVR
jgi:hypothetical protein